MTSHQPDDLSVATDLVNLCEAIGMLRDGILCLGTGFWERVQHPDFKTLDSARAYLMRQVQQLESDNISYVEAWQDLYELRP